MITQQCENMENGNTNQQELNNSSIIYTATSRGFYQEITINKNSVSIKKEIKSEAETKPVSNEQWKKILSTLKTLNLNEINTYEAPSQDRFSDRAAEAVLKVKTDKNEYKSKSFDYGKPPEKLKELIDIILETSNI